MRRVLMIPALAVIALPAAIAAQPAKAAGPYSVIKTANVGGAGRFDYVYADAAGRQLYVARLAPERAVEVYDLDSLYPIGQIKNTAGHGAAVDFKSGHGFASSKPVAMWDTKSLNVIKTIDVEGNPDGIFFDSFNRRVWILSHEAPNATVIDAATGTVVGTVDLGGAPEQAASDGKGHVYVDIEDKGNIAVVDAKTLMVTAHYDLAGKGGTCAGLALDAKHGVLFAACRDPQTMVMVGADNGKIIATLPIGRGTDGAVFNPGTMEAFSSQTDGTLTVVKEQSPAKFVVEQTVQTKPGAKTLTLDAKTGHVLLITADFTPPPPQAAAPAVALAQGGGRGGRGPQAQMVPGSFSILVVGKK